MAIKVRGGIMSTDGSVGDVAAIEIDMRDLLRAKKAGGSDGRRETGNDSSSLRYQVNRFMRSIISLMAFKGCATS